MKWFVSVALVLGLASVGSSQERLAGGILYGSNWACMVKAPSGWSMDQESLAQYHIYGLFYADGQKFGRDTPAVYINTSQLNDATDSELSKYIEWDLGNYRKDGAVVQKQKKAYSHFKTLNETYTLDLTNGVFETVVYTRNKDSAFLIILSARDKSLRTKLQGKLDEVIENMTFIEKAP